MDDNNFAKKVRRQRKIMNRLILLIFTLILIVKFCRPAENSLQNENESADFLSASTPGPISTTEIIEQAITNIESLAVKATKLARKGILPTEETDQHFNQMTETLADVIEMVKIPANAYKFLKAKGIDRAVFPNLDIKYTKLRRSLLVLLKVLFDVVPTTTDAVIPISIIDKLLDIFESDENLAMKAHVLDILYIWLPGNPKAQVRVMKVKGLEPFYHQITKLDTSVISTLLDLFNTILNEHVKVRNNTMQKSKADSDKILIYRQIGLIERMSTPTVCNGLLNILENTWTYVTEENDVIGPILDLVKNMKPYCTKVYRGRRKAKELFKVLLAYVQEDNKKEYLESLDVNVTNIKEVLQDYVRELKLVKDEL